MDAIQTLGAFPTTVEHVDFLAGDAHKWLLGPCGAGVMYVRRELQEKLNPPIYGWHNVNNPNFVAQENIEFRNDARKYEAGTANLLGIVGLLASLNQILELGVDNIARELLRKRQLLVPGLQAKGYTVLNADAPAETASGIVAFYHPGKDIATTHQKLDGCQYRHVASSGSERAELHPPLAAFLQYGRGIESRARTSLALRKGLKSALISRATTTLAR